MSTNAEATHPASFTSNDLGPLPAFLRPFVDWVARIRTTVHMKLLAGFGVIAILMLAMGLVCIGVLGRVNRQVETLTALNEQTSQAREMIYEVTAQSHYRAMALITRDDVWLDKIYAAKTLFTDQITWMRTNAIPDRTAFLDQLSATNDRFTVSSDQVTNLYREGRIDDALALHIDQEHSISHELEDSLKLMIADSQALVLKETDAFARDRRLLTIAVATFSGVSLLGALALGAILSWSLIRPVRQVDEALESIAHGEFDARVNVPNRDEFGHLTSNLNRTTEQLAAVYGDLETLNANLQTAVDVKVGELERATRLKRYLSPQLAESIISGERDVTLRPRRKFLTTFFSDVRGFTAAAERMEPEELVDHLNDYLGEMTDIVFRHGGTLDKYVGDALMVFFGDPLPQADHAERAVMMGLDMRERMLDLHETWLRKYRESFKIGIGISTGWVTVGDIGTAARSDYTVLGNEVNLASRLADRAEAGQILVTERTMLEVEGIVDGRPIDEISLKGINRPIKIYEVLPKTA
jgi:class 3 adenylate cyclase/CHASE3 domain sensor protein